ncbi:hypothetical protein [Alcaligenes faecalis]|uniref:hypothetical protein n=1 Tax=Alcaligenes faecalis TaxID=511 RepID=UPI0012699429|nr:hypothetical protein [Alcaligenes faecalis]
MSRARRTTDPVADYFRTKGVVRSALRERVTWGLDLTRFTRREAAERYMRCNPGADPICVAIVLDELDWANEKEQEMTTQRVSRGRGRAAKSTTTTSVSAEQMHRVKLMQSIAQNNPEYCRRMTVNHFALVHEHGRFPSKEAEEAVEAMVRSLYAPVVALLRKQVSKTFDRDGMLAWIRENRPSLGRGAINDIGYLYRA